MMQHKLFYWWALMILVFLGLPATALAADNPPGVAYRGHIQDFGDYPTDGSWVDSPAIIGTVGQSKRIEGFEIKLTGTVPEGMELRYNVHVQNKGWLYDENDSADWPKDGAYAGTRGNSLRIEAVKIVLTDSEGKPVGGYAVQYRGHVQNVGDLPADDSQWLADGEQLGTVGSSLRLEALLVQVVKTGTDPVEPAEPLVYDAPGSFGPKQGSETIAGDVIVAADGVTLDNLTIAGDLTISEAVGDGTVTLNNVTVEGDTLVRGGGVHSIKINGGQYRRIIMEKTASGAVRIVATGVDGLEVVVAEDASGEEIILEGTFESVTVNAPNMRVTTQGNTTTIGTMTVGVGAGGSTVTVAAGTTVRDLVLDGKAAVKGQGNVAKAAVKADGVVFDKKPGTYTVAPGVVIPPVFPTPDSGGGYTPPGPVAVTGVSLTPLTLNLVYGDTATLTATVAPVNATNPGITWTSSDTSVATVDQSGTVTAAYAGTAVITASSTADGSKKATTTVTVQGRLSIYDSKVVAGLEGGNYVVMLLEGDTFISGNNDFAINAGTTGLALSYSGPSDQYHRIFNLINTAAPGTLTLQATGLSSGIDSTTVSISVLDPVTTFAKTTFDDTTASFSWSALNGATAVSLQQQKSGDTNWSTATCDINLVSTATTVTGLEPDTTYEFRLLVTGGATPGVSNSVSVKTKPVVASVSLNKSTADLTMGYTLSLIATVLPNDAVNKTVSWTSDKPEFAIVDQNGQVTPVAPGTAVITATTANNLTASCTVTVKPVFAATTDDNTATISVYNGTETNVVIPETIDNKPVTAIGANAFSGKYMIQNVTIPDTVTSIGINAFYKTGLTGVTIPDTVTNIGASAFYECLGLTTLTFSGTPNLQTIGARAFRGCGGLSSVVIPSEVTSIGEDAFMQCKLSSLTFAADSKLQTIGNLAFYGCSDLAAVTIPNSVTSISYGAFKNCAKLTNVSFATTSKVTTIEIEAFAQSGLTSIELPDSLTSLGSNAFINCVDLLAVTFTASSQIKSLTWYTFSGCSKLNNVILPPGLTEIGTHAFFNCAALESMTIPATVTSIGANAFTGCKTESGTGLSELALTFAGNAPTLVDVTAIPAATTIRYQSGKTGFDAIKFPLCTFETY